MSLDRVRGVLSLLSSGDYQTIAIGGTNGKGSCAVMAASMLLQHGYEVGLFTSPHLVSFTERIQINGKPVDEQLLCQAFSQIDAARGDIPLTYFEFGALAAAWIFTQTNIDIAVMEVGMGGRLDAVNAFDIHACLITNIALDHTAWLGDDRESVGWEKAHIMRKGKVAVFASTEPTKTLLNYASQIDAKLLLAGRDFDYRIDEYHWHWYGPKSQLWQLTSPSLKGIAQYSNAAAVLALLTSMDGVHIDMESVSSALSQITWPGRFQVIPAREDRPMLVIDVAHNPAAVSNLKLNLNQQQVRGRTLAIFGLMRDKDLAAIIDEIGELVDEWFVVSIDDERGQDSQELSLKIKDLTINPVSAYHHAACALSTALSVSAPEDRILAFGSFHIAGDIIRHLNKTQ